MDRVRAAFSLRRNLRALLVPHPGHLRPLDGLRALSILWVVLFHCGWYSAGNVTLPQYLRLLFSPAMLPVWRGDFGVDVFFVLSGFLIAGMLADERARTGRLDLGLFYLRRLLRLWPALGAAVLLDVLLVGDHVDMTWANLFYVSNFVPIAEAAMGWTWSLAIEEQFYLLCPWLIGALAPLGTRARIGVVLGVALALAGVGAGVVAAGGFHAPDVEIVINRDLGRWAEGFDALYSKPWMRAGPLLAGVAAAYAFRAPRLMEALSRGALPGLGLLGAAWAAALATHWQGFVAPRALEVAYVATFRLVFGLAVAYVLLLSLSRHPAGRLLARLLSARALHPFAQLAYAAYLLNPIVATCMHRLLAPVVQRSAASPMLFYVPVDFALTFALAAALHLGLERPIMELRPSGRGMISPT